MGRRSDHNRETLTGLALDAAEGLVKSAGLSGITARSVAAEIGYTPGTLYNIFGNLDGLILALNYRTLGRLQSDLEAAALPTGNVRNDLETLLRLYGEHVSRAPKLWGLLIDHSLPDGVTPPDWYQARVSALLGQIEAVLHPMFDGYDPKVATQRTAQSARVLWLSVHHLLTAGTTGTLTAINAAEGRILAEDLVETYMRGVLAG